MQINLRRNLSILMAAALMTTVFASPAYAAAATGPALESASVSELRAEDTAKAPSSRTISIPDGRKAHSAGTFRTTAYCYADNGSSMTASGKNARINHTVSADLDVLPLGTQIYVDGQVYTVEDTGVHGKTVDFYLDSAESCELYGVRYKDIYIIDP